MIKAPYEPASGVENGGKHCGYTLKQVVSRTLDENDSADAMAMLRLWWDGIEPGSADEAEFKQWMSYDEKGGDDDD